jgi:hypothetical protein
VGLTAGELKLGPGISRLKAGQLRWSGAMGICGGTADLVAQEEEERADR